MSILVEAKRDLSPWEDIPQSMWQTIADQCSTPEIAEVRSRIDALRVELLDSEAWDGDTQDDINKAISFFNTLLSLKGESAG